MRVVGVEIAFGAAIIVSVIGGLILALIFDGWTRGGMATMGLGLVAIGAFLAVFALLMMTKFFTARLAVTDSFRDSVDFGLAAQVVRAHLRPWLITAIVPLALMPFTLGANWSLDRLDAGPSVLHWIVIGVATAYGTSVELHLAGQAYRLSRDTIAKRQNDVLRRAAAHRATRASWERARS